MENTPCKRIEDAPILTLWIHGTIFGLVCVIVYSVIKYWKAWYKAKPPVEESTATTDPPTTDPPTTRQPPIKPVDNFVLKMVSILHCDCCSGTRLFARGTGAPEPRICYFGTCTRCEKEHGKNIGEKGVEYIWAPGASFKDLKRHCTAALKRGEHVTTSRIKELVQAFLHESAPGGDPVVVGESDA